MADRFFEALGKQFFNWSAWVFGVIGCIGSFVLGQAYAWIGWLIALSGFLALTAHALAKHRSVRLLEEGHAKRVKELEEANRKRVDELEQENRKMTERATEAERRLNAVPMAVMEQLVSVVSVGNSARIAEAIVETAERVERLRRFLKLDDSPLKLRAFSKAAGRLYVVAKLGSVVQAGELAVGDLFSLVRKASSGVIYHCARLRVNQPSLKGEGWFEVIDADSGEMTLLSQLADSGDVKGLAGYFVQPAFDVTGYPDFSAETVKAVVKLVIAELGFGTGGVS